MRETTKRDLLKPGDPRVLKFANELQEKLLLFRLRHYRSIRPAIVAGAEELRPRSRDLLGALAAPLVRTFFVRGLLESFKGRYDPATRQPLGTQEDMLVAVLFRLIHRHPPLNAVREKELVAVTNDDLLRSGKRTISNEKQGGAMLAKLGFHSKKRTNAGWILRFDSSTQARVHQILRTHGITHLQTEELERYAKTCKECAQSLRKSGEKTKN